MDINGFLLSNGRGAGPSTESLAKEFLARATTATENNQNNAWNVNFSNGNTNNNNKYNANAVRAVAALGEEVKIGWLEAFKDCCANKKSSQECNAYRMHYELDLWILLYEVYTRTYTPGKSTCFVVTRPKLREVFAASFRDRIVHHWVCIRLNPLFEARFNAQGNVSHNCRKGYGTSSAVNSFKRDIIEVTQNYTRTAWIGKFDVMAFFMSIDPSLLWELLRPFIVENYKGHDIDTLLYLTGVIIENRPQDNCIKKSPDELYEALPPGKSLFNSQTGVPIGNLPSQLFANFFMSYLDEAMAALTRRLGGDVFRYERYVDDFEVVCTDKEVILALRPLITELLKRDLSLELHPDKFYLQEARKGSNFVGSVIKQGRTYLIRRTVHNLREALGTLNAICRDIVEAGANYNRLKELEHVVASVNSYLGFTVHCDAYNIRRKAFAAMRPEFRQICYVKCDTLACVKIRRPYRTKVYLLENEIKSNGLVLRKRKARKRRN